MNNGGPSTSKQKSGELGGDHVGWENHFLLRVPKEYAERVRKFCNNKTPDEQLRINFNPDLRRGTFRIGSDQLHFTTYDLPCVVELNKTLDNVVLYKIGDLSQLLLCTSEPQPEPKIDSPPCVETAEKGVEPTPEAAAVEAKLKAKRDKFYQFPHGLAPPLKNVRKKRFRKTKKKKYMDAPEVEKEVKRLLRDDLGAVSVRWEVVTAESTKPTVEDAQTPAQAPTNRPQDSADEMMDEDSRMTEEFSSLGRDFLKDSTSVGPPDETSQAAMVDVFGDLSSSSEELEDLE